MGGAAVRVATVITRLEGGAGQHALRGALIMDPAAYEMTIITGSGDPLLLGRAAAGGLEVLIEPALRAPIAPGSDLRALVRLRKLLGHRAFDVVHTHWPRPGWSGASPRTGPVCPGWCTPTTAFPSTSSRPLPGAGRTLRIERWLGQITDLALCVGTGVAVEAVRRQLISPERIRTIGVVVDGPRGGQAASSVADGLVPSADARPGPGPRSACPAMRPWSARSGG